MAKDHFKEHYYQKDRVDWNFNILVGQQSDYEWEIIRDLPIGSNS